MAAPRRKEIYTYEAAWPIYGLAASQRAGKEFRFAVGSFIEEYSNKVQVRTLPCSGVRNWGPARVQPRVQRCVQKKAGCLYFLLVRAASIVPPTASKCIDFPP